MTTLAGLFLGYSTQIMSLGQGVETPLKYSILSVCHYLCLCFTVKPGSIFEFMAMIVRGWSGNFGGKNEVNNVKA